MIPFYKIVIDNVIYGFGTNGNDDTIPLTELEYNNLITLFSEKPNAPAGYVYRLLDNSLRWELFESENIDENDDVSAQELLDIILGGAE